MPVFSGTNPSAGPAFARAPIGNRQLEIENLPWLYATQMTGVKLGLDSMRRLLAALGHPEVPGRDFPPVFLHVAGTNGKGSVCAFLDAACRAAGLRTGLFTSPHLVDYSERVCVDGIPITAEETDAILGRLRKLTAAWDPPPTFFELTTALALEHFRAARAEVIVWETGLGGRLDATNVVQPAVSVITPIALDHEQWLGHTVEEVAGEKAGILKPGVPAVSAPQSPEVAAVLRRAAEERGVELSFVGETWPGQISLAGSHQKRNAALAAAALRAAALPVREEDFRDGFASAEWPGRFQRLPDDRVILDGAHNPAAAARLVETWGEEFGPKARATVTLASLRDKDTPAVIRALAPLARRWIAVPARNPRSLPASELAEVIRATVPGAEVTDSPNAAAALAYAASHAEPALVTGSLFLVGEVLALFENQPPPTLSGQ